METNREGLVQEKILFDDYRRKELSALYTEEEQLKAIQNRGTVNEPIAEPNEGTVQQIEDILAYQDQEKIKINVGGRIFETQKSVLLNRESLFKVMLGSTFSIDKDDQGAFKMEEGHDPELFSIILEHIKTGSTKDIGIDYSNMASLEKMLSLSKYYGTQELTDAIFSKIQHSFQTTISEEENSASESTTVHAEKHGSETSTQFWKDMETHKQTFDKFIQKRKAEIEEQRTKVESQKINNETLKLNVSGRHFALSVADIAIYPSSILFQLYERLAEQKKTNGTSTFTCINYLDVIFIDRDGDTFELIETFLRTGTISHIPNIRSIKKRVQKEAKYYGITGLEEFFSPMRYPLESIGQENIEMKQQEDLLRSLFAKDRDNAVLDDPYINMLPVFDLLDTFHPQDTQENIPQLFNFVLPVTEGMFCHDNSCNHMKTRKYYLKQQGTQIVQSLDEFKEQWGAFTTYLFDDVDWTGMFAAGGSVLASAQKVNDLESVRSFFYSLRGRYTSNWRKDTNEEYVEEINELMVDDNKEGEYSDLSDEEVSKNAEELAKKKNWLRSVSGFAGLEAMNKESLLITHYERSIQWQ